MNELATPRAGWWKKGMDAPLPYAHHTEEARVSHMSVTELVDCNFLYKATDKTGLAFDFLWKDVEEYNLWRI